jgi:hypothetical protein
MAPGRTSMWKQLIALFIRVAMWMLLITSAIGLIMTTTILTQLLF